MASLIYNVLIFAIQSQGPPPPAGGTGSRGPHLPIDENIWILLAMGIFLGIYIIYKRNRSSINKAS
jgi:hypothetical protein